MKQNQTVGFESGIKGMPVLDAKIGDKIGIVSDLIIDPVEGKLLGIALTRPDKEIRSIKTGDLHIGDDAVMSIGSTPAALDYFGDFAGGIAATEIMEAKLVSNDGKLIGKIQEIYLALYDLTIYYKVAESSFQQIFGKGFYLSAKAPLAYSRNDKRFIVPADIQKQHAKKNLSDLITTAGEGEQRIA
jgi:uncharacterized protein YrrD